MVHFTYLVIPHSILWSLLFILTEYASHNSLRLSCGVGKDILVPTTRKTVLRNIFSYLDVVQ